MASVPVRVRRRPPAPPQAAGLLAVGASQGVHDRAPRFLTAGRESRSELQNVLVLREINRPWVLRLLERTRPLHRESYPLLHTPQGSQRTVGNGGR
jgi:hypothetical protein